jgi:hypothetical protein
MPRSALVAGAAGLEDFSQRAASLAQGRTQERKGLKKTKGVLEEVLFFPLKSADSPR